MSRRKDIALTLTGVAVGLTIGGQSAIAALTANPSNQAFYLDGQRISLTAYSIAGNNYVKLRDIGRAVDFGVTYDGANNSVYIDPEEPYVEEAKAPAGTGGVSLTANLDIRQEIIRLVNQARRENGVAELSVNRALMDAAQTCSDRLYSWHHTQEECEAVAAAGYPNGFGTNITVFTGVAAKDAAQRAVTNWLNSPGHRATMLDQDCDSLGVGITDSGSATYCYLFLGNPNSVNPYG